MEIKDILSELITVATNTLNERGTPENFDLEEFLDVLESYYEELDEIDEFMYYDDEDEGGFGNDWDDEDNY
jgi:pantothenate kinase